MKKFVLSLLVFVFSSMSSLVFATTQVSYNVAGTVASVRHGATHTTSFSSNFGSNAIFAPRNAAMAGQRPRAMQRMMVNQPQYKNPYGRISSNEGVPIQVSQESRFSKNCTISTPKSYTKNGVTYYN
jgi:hypothetical protein